MDSPDRERDPVASAIDDVFDSSLQPLPPTLHDLALEAFHRRPADPVAEIRSDSAGEEFLTIRGVALPRSLVFVAGGYEMSLVLRGSQLTVRLVPPGSYLCRVESIGPHAWCRRSEVVAGDDGEVTVASVSLPARVRVTAPGGAFVTPWIVG